MSARGTKGPIFEVDFLQNLQSLIARSIFRILSGTPKVLACELPVVAITVSEIWGFKIFPPKVNAQNYSETGIGMEIAVILETGIGTVAVYFEKKNSKCVETRRFRGFCSPAKFGLRDFLYGPI